jgi:D-alanyl-D-alanine carboxypeptidase
MNKRWQDFFNIENRTKYFLHILVFLLLSAVVIFGLLLIGNHVLKREQKRLAQKNQNSFTNVELVAKSAVVWDVINQRELFAKNPDQPLPLASLTKVMTAITTASLPKDSNIKIIPEDLTPEGDSNLVVGDNWNLKDLRDFTLLTSSNDGALALALATEPQKTTSQNENLFVYQMNQAATLIGLNNSKFFNEHGLDKKSDQSGAYGSARDMALLFEYALKKYPDLLEATRYKNLTFNSAEKVYNGQNTNVAVDQIPNLIASKTGFTDLAGGNLVIAYDAGLNRPIIISVLGSTETGRFEDTLKLVDASLKYIQQNN